MTLIPRFAEQERPDACAIACLRMILAHQGQKISEAEMVQLTDLQEGGLTPDELSRLAHHFGLPATKEQADETRMLELVNKSRFPIVFLFRRPLDGVDLTHAVIPLRCSRHYVTLLDPLRGERRVTIRKFEKARRMVGQWIVIWNKRTDETGLSPT